MPILPPPHAKRVFQGNKIDLWQWDQMLFDGTTDVFECITRQDSVVVIPFLDAETVLLTTQSQPTKPEPFLDFPGGRVDAGEDQQTAAMREMQEEIGYTANRMIEWKRLEIRSLERFERVLYVTTDLQNTLSLHHDAGEKIETLKVPWNNIVELCLQGKLRQSHVMLTILQMEFDPVTKHRLHHWLQNA